ncbi:MAG: IS110 family transposase [Planctomycetales bacterium]|nr:IS110 family transposase [Planctomycetales bacterium]
MAHRPGTHRFENVRQVSAYFGLVPRQYQYQSGETDRNGRITKRGNPLARTILVECAWASLRYNPWAKGIYETICGEQKTRKKKAGIVLARKITVIAWAMLRDEKDWEPKRMIEVTESYRATRTTRIVCLMQRHRRNESVLVAPDTSHEPATNPHQNRTRVSGEKPATNTVTIDQGIDLPKCVSTEQS